MEIDKIKKELESDIRHKFIQKEFDYKESDRLQVCIHRVIDGYVSYCSIANIEEIVKELGINKVMWLEETYTNEFGSLEKTGTDKLRTLLYWYFEQTFIDDGTFEDLEK